MRVLVLSGGGLFGAWQAGAWSVLAKTWTPDLIIGVSIGSLNGYILASEISPEDLMERWRNPQFRPFRKLHENLRLMTSHYTLRRPFALTVTDLLTMKPRIYRDAEITWRHLAASCAVPLALPQMKIDGRWCGDGGLVEALPVSSAVDLGATEILGLYVVPGYPALMAPFVNGFRSLFAPKRGVPQGVSVTVLAPSVTLGDLKSTLWATQQQIEKWIQLGERDAEAWAREKSFPS
jgi:predicted acylesterase/phospholipase RssA